ncbi:MAG: type I DNA topoisomerase [Proteobacteria bacterium]|nr:type I DNA topoisomerase [Pseudomonadota bacterium]
MENRVVIVESPSKAKTINKYLGRGYEVIASYGHVRDLPSKDGSVDPDNRFAMIWELDGRGAKQVSAIANAVKDADTVILATDPDREGEAISWHLLETLRNRKVLKDKKVQRVTFNAITKDSVAAAMAAPREIDQALVDAYLARRALDYLVGFQLSPVLWRKLPGARSAGRVQSVSLRLVCDRESEIEKFVTKEYWSLTARLATPKGEEFEARLVGADGKKISRLDIGSSKEAEAFKTALERARFKVAAIEAKPAKRHPYPPFTTSTLQQEASRKLGFAPAITMRIAQKLYEGVDIGGETAGLITYMRTDGVDIAPEARAQVRAYIGKSYDKPYLPEAPRAYSTKAKNAQEAHECIRPTDAFRVPKAVKAYLSADEFALYELIWKRTIASQMESARLERTTADILAEADGRKLDLRASGQVVTFDGFLALYTETSDDDEDEENRRLPAMNAGDALAKKALSATQHFTEPPPRYSEASLIKRMEELGIGRPSTYAATLAVLRDREYVRIEKKRLVPEDKGRIVTAFLESFFAKYVEYDFTADLENDLDRISNAEVDWRAVLDDFWRDFKAAIESAKERRTTEVLEGLNEHLGPMIFKDKGDGSNPRACPKCGSGQLSLKLGKLGPFVGCSNYPECRFTRPLSVPNGEDGENAGASGTMTLGTDPETGLEVTIRDGRFGPYVQLGEGEKPKRASLAKGMTLKSVDLATALSLLALPREVGKHPESGEPILAGIGRYGPYVQHNKTYANLEATDDVFTIGMNRAVDLIATKEAGGGKRFGRAAGANAGKLLGQHPDGGDVTLRDGRFGAYVNWTTVNATIPKNVDKEALALPEALAIIAARIDALGGIPEKKGSRKSTTKSAGKGAKAKAGDDAATPKAKAPAKKTAKPKAAAKSTAKSKPKAG